MKAAAFEGRFGIHAFPDLRRIMTRFGDGVEDEAAEIVEDRAAAIDLDAVEERSAV